MNPAGTRLGKYELHTEIGVGGMGVVYRGYDPTLDRPVAIKILASHLAREEKFVERFMREARAAARLKHPHIVTIYDVGEANGQYYFVMEYLEGRTLNQVLHEQDQLPTDDILSILSQLADGLDAAHAHGLVHRDVKPANVIVDDQGQVTLTDFGLVQAAQETRLTTTGETIGTPQYMSPEHALGEKVGPPADLYSLAIIAYEMLSGVPPFDADSTPAILHKQVYEPPPSIADRRPDLPPAVDAVLRRALNKDPAARHPSGADFVAALKDALEGKALLGVAAQPVKGLTKAMPRTPAPAVDAVDQPQPATSLSVPAPPIFARAPRRYPDLPTGEVEIPPPTQAPTEPSFSWVSVLLPLGATVIGLGVMAAATAASQGSTSLLLIAGSAAMMLASYSATIVSHFVQKSAYHKKVQQRKQKYEALLQRQGRELDKLRDRQRTAMRQNDPGPAECLEIVERQEPRRLWARAPEDDDFLTLRLGLGRRPFAVTVKPPKQQSPLEPDPLIKAAQDMALRFAQVPETPVTLPLRRAGVAGLAGPRDAVLNGARALAVQIAAHHSPHEVKIVAVYPAGEADDWDWLRWLPHTWSDDRNHRFLAREKGAAHDLLTSFYDLLNRRRLRVRPDGESPPPLPYLVFFLADPRLVEGETILPLLLQQSSNLGACSIFLADRVEALPKGCRAMAEVGPGQPRLLSRVSDSTSPTYEPDRVSPELAERLSRAMAPIRMKQLSSATEIPTTVTLLDALGVKLVEDLDILRNWRTNDPYRSMAIPIGMRAGGELQYLDLHEPGSKPDPQRGHGPNGLVAGTVGSGKSEILLSLIAGMAVNFHPHQVVFVLLDFKGGGMANAVEGLPHVVNSITNLELDQVPRALSSLEAELERRERLFEKAGVSHIDDYMALYRKEKVKDALPYLVLIVDEFTVLKDKRPEDMRRFVMIAVKGRALGVRMILATQKPAGVISEQIDANTRFRLCLRVARPEDSTEMIKRPDAASLTGAGRCFIRVGDDELFELFQSAWSGAPYAPGGYVASDPHEIVEVALDGSRRPLRLSPRPTTIRAAGKQLEAVIAHIQEAARQAGIRPLRGPWLPPLPEQVTLEEIRPDGGWDGQTWQPALGWLSPVVGLLDDPAHQRQESLRLDLSDGHLAVYGAPGSGKTTFVQTLVTSLALTHSPQDVHVYLLDMGGRLLTTFASLPHVGDVVLADEDEKLDRLRGYLLREMEERKEHFAQAGVGTLQDYRSATGESLPAIVVILDNYSNFDKKFPNPEDLEPWVQIFREGGNLGVHIVLTASRPSAVKHKIIGNIATSAAFELTDPGEYSMVVGRTGGKTPAPLPGRGLVKGRPPLEFQTALPAAGDTEAARTASLKTLIEQMAHGWSRPAAPPIPMLPDVVPLCELLTPGDAWPPPPTDGSLAVPLGLDVDDLSPVEVDLWDGPHFLITGPLESGKTTFLQTWLLALAERFSPQQLRLYLVDFRRVGLFPLQRLPHVRAYVKDDDQLGDALAEIFHALQERRQARDEARREAGGMLDEKTFIARYPALVMAIDDFDAFKAESQPGDTSRLEEMIRRQRGLGFYLLVAGMYTDLGAAFDGWVNALKELRTGFLLGSSSDDSQLFSLRLPYAEKNKILPPGRGYYARRRRHRKVQVATCHTGETMLADWIVRITNREP